MGKLGFSTLRSTCRMYKCHGVPLLVEAHFVCPIIRLQYDSHNRTRTGVYLIHGIMEIRPVLFSGLLIPQGLTDFMKISCDLWAHQAIQLPPYRPQILHFQTPCRWKPRKRDGDTWFHNCFLIHKKEMMWLIAFAWHYTSVWFVMICSAIWRSFGLCNLFMSKSEWINKGDTSITHWLDFSTCLLNESVALCGVCHLLSHHVVVFLKPVQFIS